MMIYTLSKGKHIYEYSWASPGVEANGVFGAIEDLYYATLVVAGLGYSGDGTPSPSGRRLGLFPGVVGHVRRRRQEL